jgi:hypothetical protein
MTASPRDPRAVVDYRIPATELKVGDVVNTSPGGPDDWQQVVAVHGKGSGTDSAADAQLAELMAEIGDRYVMVEMTDVAAVDSNVYLTADTAMLFGSDSEDDTSVLDAVSGPDDRRTYLYTVHELVTVRGPA